jgi:DUF4097 and DUF4098 domain-containing protein YvlB
MFSNPARALLPGVLLICAGCGFQRMPFSAKDVITKTFPTNVTPKVVAETFNGHVEVTVGDEKSVQVEVTRHSRGRTEESAKADLENIELKTTEEGDTIRIVCRPKNDQLFSQRSADVDVHVPLATRLELTTSNGHIKSVGLAGDIEATTSNGSIETKGNRGVLKLETSNGSIHADGGDGKVDLTTSNGSIQATATKPVVVDARTSNGNIHFTGKLAAGDQRFQTTNGKVVLELPADSAFQVKASTSLGAVKTDFDLSETKEKSNSRLAGTVGKDPKVTINASSTTGGVEILKAK